MAEIDESDELGELIFIGHYINTHIKLETTMEAIIRSYFYPDLAEEATEADIEKWEKKISKIDDFFIHSLFSRIEYSLKKDLVSYIIQEANPTYFKKNKHIFDMLGYFGEVRNVIAHWPHFVSGSTLIYYKFGSKFKELQSIGMEDGKKKTVNTPYLDLKTDALFFTTEVRRIVLAQLSSAQLIMMNYKIVKSTKYSKEYSEETLEVKNRAVESFPSAELFTEKMGVYELLNKEPPKKSKPKGKKTGQ